MPASLSARNLTYSLGRRPILVGVDVDLHAGTRLGIVGPNGVGKSTLLRILAGRLRPDDGSVAVRPSTATVGYLDQELPRSPGVTVADHLRQRTGVAEADQALDAATTALASGDDGAGDAYAEALERWTSLGCADFDVRLEQVAADLGLDASALGQATATLSGGQASRVGLALVLLSRFDVTLLDEPTNDLDFAGLDRLERFVTQGHGALAVVSHDREFLDRTITAVLELDDHAHTATFYDGGWSSYLDERATARRHAEDAYGVYVGQRDALKARAQRERQWATAGVSKEKKNPRDNDKAQRDFRINRTEKLASKARLTERALDRLDVVDKPFEGWELRFSIAQAPRSGQVVAVLDGLVVERGAFRLGPIDLELTYGDRLGLLGPNGSGKTTLLEVLLGRLEPTSGVAKLGPSVVVGELGQRRQSFVGDEPLLRAFTDDTGLLDAPARSLLAKFGLDATAVTRPAGSLSPGERTRAELARFQAVGVNLLVLDEPSNHLDLPAIEQLEQALGSYDGTLVLVTHDRRLLEAIELTRVLDLA